MPWLVDFRLYRSPKNGLIACRRLFGRWTVYVGGIMQTSPYVTGMWRDALTRLPGDFLPRRLLLLGLGAGGIVPELRRRFPEAELTAVEWDERMVDLATKLNFYGGAAAPTVVVGDAREVVPRLAGEFDLVLFDLFTAGQPAVAEGDDAFVAALAARLSPGGLVLVNTFATPALFGLFDRHFARVTDWLWKYNRLGLFCRS
jgi:spermidine synthase